jgi:hypothetical protein
LNLTIILVIREERAHLAMKEHHMTRVVIFSCFTAGVTYVRRCGFQWLLYGQNVNHNLVGNGHEARTHVTGKQKIEKSARTH